MSHLQPVDAAFVADLRARGTAPSEQTVTSVELCRTARISYRQLDYWSRTGRLRSTLHDRTGEVIDPAKVRAMRDRYQVYDQSSGSGFSRRYPVIEMRVASVMKRLLDVGLALPQSHDAARAHVADPDEPIILGPGLALIITGEDDDEPAQVGAR